MIAEKLRRAFVSFCVILCLVTQKLALHLAGFEFSLVIFIFPVLMLGLFFLHQIRVNSGRLFMFCIVAFLSAVSFLVNIYSSGLTSYVYFLILYLFLCFDFPLSDDIRGTVVSTVRVVLIGSAFIGIAQFMGQLAGLKYVDIFDMVPEQFKLSGFNTYYPLFYGSRIIKSNGWLYLEPSFFSQFMALGILIELSLSGKRLGAREITRIAIYGVGLICSFSGTGILILLFFFIPALRKISPSRRIIIILGMIVVFILFAASEYADAIFRRVSEFGSNSSSAAIRFINPYKEAFHPADGKTFFFGVGAGRSIVGTRLQSNHNAVTKVMIEYGFFCLLAFIVYIWKVFNRNGVSVFSIGVIFMFLFLSGSLLQPSILLPLFFLIELIRPRESVVIKGVSAE